MDPVDPVCSSLSLLAELLLVQERMQELEREKDTLQLQVTVLEDQIESQSRRIQEIGKDYVSNSVADPDPGSGAFFTPGSGMGKIRIRIRDEQPGPYFREYRNIFLG